MRAFSLFLIAVGAILAFAVNIWVDGVELVTVGIILMVVGAIGFIAGMFRASSSTTRTREVSDDGRVVTEDTVHRTA